MIRFFISLVLCLSLGKLLAQNQKVDSLKAQLKRSKSVQKIDILNQLSYQYRLYNLDSSLMYSKEALNLAQQNNYPKGEADAYNFMGVAYKRRGEYDQAQNVFEKALQIRKKINDLKGLAASYTNIGELYRNHGDYKNALEYSREALKIDQQNKDLVGISYSLNNIGEIYTYQGNYAKALDYCLQSMRIREQIGDEQGLATSQNYIGNIYLYQDNLQQALNFYQKSLAIRQKIKEDKGIGASYHAIGTVYLYKKDYEKAQEYLQKAIEIRQTIHDLRGQANSIYDLGRVMLAQQRYELAYLNFEKAYQIYHDIADTAYICLPLLGMAEVNLYKNQSPNAKKQALAALNIAQNTNLKESVKEAYKLLSQIFEKENDLAQSLKYYKLYVAQKDSLVNEANLKLVRGLQFDYEIEKKENEIKLLNKEQDLKNLQIKRQNLTLGAVLVVLLLVVLLTYISYRAYKNSQKANALLHSQKAEIQTRNEELHQQTEEIRSQRDFIEQQNHNLKSSNQKITDSIRYAQSIQEAILPFEERMKAHLNEYFVLYKPKDIVAGDFYWLGQEQGRTIFAVIDCTGHGVPGAFMSMIAYALMNQIVHANKVIVPSQILEKLHKQIRKALRQEQRANDDGMDAAICQIYRKANHIEVLFGGARLPVYYTQNGELCEIKGTRRSLGGMHHSEKFFENEAFILQPKENIYLASDGFIDQNNANNENYGSLRFKKLLQDIHRLSMREQKKYLENKLAIYQDNVEQRDDITVVGIRF